MGSLSGKRLSMSIDNVQLNNYISRQIKIDNQFMNGKSKFIEHAQPQLIRFLIMFSVNNLVALVGKNYREFAEQKRREEMQRINKKEISKKIYVHTKKNKKKVKCLVQRVAYKSNIHY